MRFNGSLPYIKRALAAGFEGTIQAYMDYPPDWMLVGGDTNKTVDARYLSVLANYMARCAQASLDAVTAAGGE